MVTPPLPPIADWDAERAEIEAAFARRESVWAAKVATMEEDKVGAQSDLAAAIHGINVAKEAELARMREDHKVPSSPHHTLHITMDSTGPTPIST